MTADAVLEAIVEPTSSRRLLLELQGVAEQQRLADRWTDAALLVGGIRRQLR